MESSATLDCKVIRNIYPSANLLPFLSDEEFTKLAADIRDNGLQEPIVIHNDQIVDGRARGKACDLFNIPPRYKEFDQTDLAPTEFILQMFFKTRPLSNKSQRATLVIECLPQFIIERADLPSIKGNSMRRLADQAAIGHGLAWEAHQVKKYQPSSFDLIKSGELLLNPVYERLAAELGHSTRDKRAKTKGGRPRKPIKDLKCVPIDIRAGQIQVLASQGWHSGQIAQELKIGEAQIRSIAIRKGITIQADKAVTRRLDVNRFIDETVMNVQTNLVGLEMIDGLDSQIDQSRVEEWSESLKESIDALNQLLKQLRRTHD